MITSVTNQPSSVSNKITKKKLTCTAKNNTITYGDTPANDGVTYEPSDFVSGDNVNVVTGDINYTYTYTQGGNCGNYDINISTSTLTADNYEIQYEKGTLTVEPKEVSVIWSNTELTYNGSPQKPTAIVNSEDLVANTTCELSVLGEQTNAGENYTATASIVSNTNYKLSNSSSSTTFKIKNAKSEVATEPTALSLTYEGTPQTLISGGTATNGTMKYSLTSGGEYSADLPQSTNAQTYTVYYKVFGNPNYDDTEEKSINVTISPASLTITANENTITYGQEPSNDGVSYSGLKNNETASVLNGINLSYSYNYNQYEDCGQNYTITVSGQENVGNYTISYQNGTLKVTPKNLTITWGTNTFTYDGATKMPTATLVGVVNNDDCDKIITEKDGKESINVGKYTATATLTGTKINNYVLDDSQKDQDYEIIRATPNIDEIGLPSTPSNGTVAADGVTELPYNGLQQSLAASGQGNPTGTKFQYKVGSDGTYEDEIPTRKDVGEYTVYYRIVDTDGNHNNVQNDETQNFKVRITKVPLTITANNETINYGSAAPSYTVSYSGFC